MDKWQAKKAELLVKHLNSGSIFGNKVFLHKDRFGYYLDTQHLLLAVDNFSRKNPKIIRNLKNKFSYEFLNTSLYRIYLKMILNCDEYKRDKYDVVLYAIQEKPFSTFFGYILYTITKLFKLCTIGVVMLLPFVIGCWFSPEFTNSPIYNLAYVLFVIIYFSSYFYYRTKPFINQDMIDYRLS